jgi:hypothetical protein
LRRRHELFFLALVLSTAASAFADKIPDSFRDGDGASVYAQGSSDQKAFQAVSVHRDFGVSEFKEDEFGIEFNPAVQMWDFGKDLKISEVGRPSNFGLDTGKDEMRLFYLGSHHGDLFRRDKEKGWSSHNDNDLGDGDATLSVVAVPEPKPGTLLLFGLAGLGMILYRRVTL